jgi:hypothetical protein
VERIGEQLGALKSQITEDIKANVMLRKEVVLVHKQPGYPGIYPPPHMTCMHPPPTDITPLLLAIRGFQA